MYLLLFIFYFLEDSKIMIPKKKKSVKKISFSPNTNQNYSIS